MPVDLNQSEAKHIYHGMNKEYAMTEIYHRQLRERKARQLKEKKAMRPTFWNLLPFIMLLVLVIFAIAVLVMQASGG